MVKNILVTALVFCIMNTIAQQSAIGNSVQSEAEFHTAINPTDPDHIVLSVMRFDQIDDSVDLEVLLNIYYTTDGGSSWNLSDFTGIYDGYAPFLTDPVLSFNEQGEILLVVLVLEDENADELKTALSKSVDGGATWSFLRFIDSNEEPDKPWITVDTHAQSPFFGNIYIPQIEGLESNNNEDFRLYTLSSDLQTITSSSIPNGISFPNVVVKKNGDVFVSSLMTGFGDTPDVPAEIFIQQYTNGGQQLAHSTKITEFRDFVNFDDFDDFELSNRFIHLPSLAIDNSGGDYDGRLYMSYTASEDLMNPEFMDIYLTYSDDNGLTWSTPTVVHPDTPEKTQQFYNSIFVNSKGVVVLDWYDRRNYPNTSSQTDFYLGISEDGGASFSEIKLNSSATDFEAFKSIADGFGIGDYHQLVASDDYAFAFWSDGRTNDGSVVIYTSKIDLNNVLAVPEFGVLSKAISISSPYYNTVDKHVSVDISLKQHSQLGYQIYDMNGRNIYKSKQKNYKPGVHVLKIDKMFTRGTYVLSVFDTKGYFKNIPFVQGGY